MEYTTLEIEEQFDEMLNETNELIKIGNLTYLPSQVLKNTDPIAYRIGLSEFEDYMKED